MVSSIGDPDATGRGTLLRLPEIAERTGLAPGTIRSKHHGGTMPCVWKLGRRLVAWEADLAAWLQAEQERTTKHAGTGPYERLVTECPDLTALRRLVVREEVIRHAMAETGEDRQTIVDLIAAGNSMDQESVLSLTEGAPTTLRAALQAYVDGLEQSAEEDERLMAQEAYTDLEAILSYPYPGAVTLEIDNETEGETTIISVNGREVARANHDEHGYAGMELAGTVAHAVFNAVAP